MSMRAKLLRISLFATFCSVLLSLYLAANMFYYDNSKTSVQERVSNQCLKPYKLLVFAYYRSGSTLTSEVVTAHPDTFYMFEVSKALYIDWLSALIDRSLQETLVVRSIYRMFQCDFSHVPVEYLLNPFNWKHGGAPMAPFLQCAQNKQLNTHTLVDCWASVKDKCPWKTPFEIHFDEVQNCYEAKASASNRFRGDQSRNDYDESMAQLEDKFVTYHRCIADLRKRVTPCIPLLRDSCLRAPVRVIKVIRMDMAAVDDLLDLDNSVKVVHLVRDPRGMAASVRNVEMAPFVCARLLRDLESANEIQRKRPNNIIKVRYEDIVLQPEITVQHIYHLFSCLNSTEYYNAWRAKINNPTNNAGYEGTYRQNSSAEAYDWMVTLSVRNQEILLQEESCMQVIKNLNYPLTSFANASNIF